VLAYLEKAWPMNEDETLQVSATAIVIALIATVIPFGYLLAPLILGGFVPRYRTMLLATCGLIAWVVFTGTFEWVRHGQTFMPENYVTDRLLLFGPWYLGLSHAAYLVQSIVRVIRRGPADSLDDHEGLGLKKAPLVPAGPPPTPSRASALETPSYRARRPLEEAQRAPPPPPPSPPPETTRPTAKPTPPSGKGLGLGRGVAVFLTVFALGIAAALGALAALEGLSLADIQARLSGPSPSSGPDATAPTDTATPSLVGGGPDSGPAGLCDTPDAYPFLVPDNAPYALTRQTVDGVPFVWLTDRNGDVWWMEDILGGGQTAARISGPGGHDCGVYMDGFLSYGSHVYAFDGQRLENRDVVCTVGTTAIDCVSRTGR